MIQLYTGDGKGKTTAAVGAAIRMAGADGRVLFFQFMKGSDTSEINILNRIPNIEVSRLSKDYGFSKNFDEATTKAVIEEHNTMLKNAIKRIYDEEIDMVVLDELSSAYNLDLVDDSLVAEIVSAISNTDIKTELVITGRDADAYFVSVADYITNMVKVKHPYDNDKVARHGIEY